MGGELPSDWESDGDVIPGCDGTKSPVFVPKRQVRIPKIPTEEAERAASGGVTYIFKTV